ncbi:serine/threonine-protein kinase LATS2 isoform X3 [Pipistrellus kuhlii]|uniref:serine/threonine-protein kinase LATS2 isoform X3 n=1 Tax=Pipistrellus kuhlii TaxID=59472 RepID=UPI00174F4186|nr:serine/threonine-protein kinase LATS2 isoform X3 [Pipistrellus kuhlii]
MRPKTFPATTYSGNSRQRLQEIREGLKQPSKSSTHGPPVGPNDTSLDSNVLGGKDIARQQQPRTAPKFGPYQKALREIRYSLLPFANESGPPASAEVNRQMLQELVNAGCDQEMAGRALKQTGSRSIEAALDYISKMGYLDPRKEQIVRVIKQTSPGKGVASTSVPRRPSFEGGGDPFPPYHPMSGAYEGSTVLEEVPRQYMDFLFAGVSPHSTPGGLQHQSKGYSASLETSGMNFPMAGPEGQGVLLQGPHYRPHLLVPGAPPGYGIQRSPSFQNKVPPDTTGYAGLATKGLAGQPGAGHPFPVVGATAGSYMSHPHHKQAPQMHVMAPPQGLLAPSRNSLNVDLYEASSTPVQSWPVPTLTRRDSMQKQALGLEGSVPSRSSSFSSHQQPVATASPNTITAVTAAHILHPVKSVRVLRPEPQTAVGPSHPAWVPAPAPAPGPEGPDSTDEQPPPLVGVGPYPRDVDVRCPPPPYPKHLLRGAVEQVDMDCLCAGVEQQLWSTPSEPPNRGHKGAKADRAGKDKKLIQTSPVPVRKKSCDEEKRESRIKSYSPYAFKFFMEQHVENVIKTYQQKVNRRLQLEQEMARAGLCEAEQEQMRKILYQKESNYNRLKRAKMDKSMFVKIKTLGIGAFGEVCLACKVDTHALYAMKTLRKKDVLNRNQVAHVKAERDILAEADNEWVVKLYYSFQDKDSLYFVMDYIPGGDMMSLLIRMEIFPEHLARFYIAELTLAIESVHKMGFIHRDIKPDNILIDLDGHIKLTDFGLCTGFRWTHNSKYYQKGYTQLCDWWSVGVILFEMLVGQPPFLAPTPTETQLKVINWENTLHIPAQVKLSPEARDLIIKLCCAADHRLGRNGADDLKAHPFFVTIDFSRDIRKQPAPYIPKISHPMDTSNFDPVDEESPWNDASEDSAKAWDTLTFPNNKHPEHAFYEFTFRRFFDDNGYPFRCPKPSGAEELQAENSNLENSNLVDQTEGCQPVQSTLSFLVCS